MLKFGIVCRSHKIDCLRLPSLALGYHDDVIKWKHFPNYWPFVRGIHRSPVNSPHKGQWRGALTFSLICVWINGWVNNREAGDLRRCRAHYDVIVTWNYFAGVSEAILTNVDKVTHCGLVTPYEGRDLDQHWFSEWLVAWWHQVITWTNVDLSSLRSSDVHLRSISLEISQPPVNEISLKIIFLRFYWNLPGGPWVNEVSPIWTDHVTVKK